MSIVLPPKVNGAVYGFLDVKVDQIIWKRRSAVPVLVKVTWWGQDVPDQLFRIGNDKHEKTVHTYEIQTSTHLFRNYLMNCKNLTLSVVDEQMGSCIGTCEISNLCKTIGEVPYESFYPIYSSSRSIIGDLHVGFRLSMNVANKTLRKSSITKNISSSLPSSPERSNNNVRDIQSAVCLNKLPDLDNDHVITNKLVEKLLNQGQRLRNAMIETILENDPLNTEVYSFRPQQSDVQITPTLPLDSLNNLPSEKTDSGNRIFDYLMGANMTNIEEKQALETLRTFSPTASMIKLASELYFHPEDASKTHDKAINKTNRDDETRPRDIHKPSEKYRYLLQDSQSQSSSSQADSDTTLLQFVDSIKIYVHTLKLNSAGWRKVVGSVAFQTVRPPTFFIEYSVPQVLAQDMTKSKSKIDADLRKNKSTRFCSKKIINEVVHFKQQSIHSVHNLPKLNLGALSLELKVHCRTVSQKGATQVGIAKYSFADVGQNPNLTCDQELALLDPNKPLAIGTLKIRVQLGCDKLYFGQEFLDAIKCGIQNRKLSNSDSLTQHCDENQIQMEFVQKSCTERKVLKGKPQLPQNSHQSKFEKKIMHTKKITNTPPIISPVDDKSLKFPVPLNNLDVPKLLQGLIYLSEVLYATDQERCTFLVCRAFWREDTTTSKLSHHTQRAVFNFREIVPILYDAAFLMRTKNNYLIIEIWENDGATENLLGICKLPLHQFYIAYRDPRVTTHLIESKFPVVGFDGWENIINPLTGQQCGQLQALLAVGSEAQLNFLEVCRGLNEPCVVVNKYAIDSEYLAHVLKKDTESECKRKKVIESINSNNKNENIDKQKHFIENDNLLISPDSSVQNKIQPPIKTVIDKGLQIHGVSSSSTQTDDILLPVILENRMAESLNNIENFNVPSGGELADEQRDILHRNFMESFITLASQVPLQVATNTCSNLDSKAQSQAAQILEGQGQSQHVHKTKAVQTNKINVSTSEGTQTTPRIEETSKLFEMLQKALNPVPNAVPITNGNFDVVNTPQYCMKDANLTTEVNNTLLREVKETLVTEVNDTVSNRSENVFKALIVVVNAVQLAVRKRRLKHKSRQTKKHEITPSTYVSFEPLQNKDILHTPIVQKSSSPKWNHHFECYIPVDLLYDDQKRLIFKVWSKNGGDLSQPNSIADSVIGFAALDLTVLSAGLPSIQGWFNILDFSSRCNGQIKIHLTPLEDITRFAPNSLSTSIPTTPIMEMFDVCPSTSLLSTTLKRKFTELDEITERLKQRLMDVTNDDDNENYRDEYVNEFEHDLNTECLEDNEDFDFTRLEVTLDAQKVNKSDCFNTLISAISTVDSGYNECDVSRSYNYTQPFTTIHHDELNDVSSTSAMAVDTLVDTSDKSPTQSIIEIDTRLKESKLQFDSLFEKLSLHSAVLNQELAKNTSSSLENSVFDFGLSMEFAQNHVLEDIKEESTDGDSARSKNQNNDLDGLSVNTESSSDTVNKTYDRVELPDTDSEDSSYGLNSETMLLRQAPDGAGITSIENLAQVSLGKK